MVEVVLLHELLESLIASHFHELELPLVPNIHGAGSDERELNSESPVDAGAVEADEDAVVKRNPLRVSLPAVEALPVLLNLHEFLESLLLSLLEGTRHLISIIYIIIL